MPTSMCSPSRPLNLTFVFVQIRFPCLARQKQEAERLQKQKEDELEEQRILLEQQKEDELARERADAELARQKAQEAEQEKIRLANEKNRLSAQVGPLLYTQNL